MKRILTKRIGLTFSVLKSFQGNTRTCLLVEPLWGIPFNLFAPYASLYMLALGCTKEQVGTITAIGLIFQMIFALIGGYITDKLGRKRTSLIFDLLSWSIPCLIWMVAQNYYYFLIAAILNGMVRIVQNSWNCLMIEDAPPEQRVHIYTWAEVAGILAGFFAPLAGFFVEQFTLVPAVRGLYAFAALSMTFMFLIRNYYTEETMIGRKKMLEARLHTFVTAVREYPALIKTLFTHPLTRAAFLLLLLNNVQIVFRNTFLGIVLNKGMGIPQGTLGIFPAVGSAIAMIIYIFVMPTLGSRPPEKPLLFGLIIFLGGSFLLLVTPERNLFWALGAYFISSVGSAFLTPFVNGNIANRIMDEHRAKQMSIVYAVVYGGSAPFGWFSGYLAMTNARFPLLVSIGAAFLSLGILGSSFYYTRKEKLDMPAR
jgi:MFS family permease